MGVHFLSFLSPVLRLNLAAFAKSPQGKETSLPLQDGPAQPSSDEKGVVELASLLVHVREEPFATEPVKNQ